MSIPRFLRLCLLSVTLSTVTCAVRRTPEPPALVSQVQTLAVQDRSAALSMLEERLSGRLDPETEPWAMLWAGELRRLEGDDEQARAWLRTLTERYPASPLKEAALLGLAVIDADDAPSGNTLATLQLLSEKGAPDTMNADRYRILARVAADDGSQPNKVRDLVRKAVGYAESDPEVKARVFNDLNDLITADQATQLTGIEVSETERAEEQTYQRALSALEADAFEEAITLSRQFLETWPDSTHAREVGYFIRRAEAGDRMVARKVGVLLPMTGKYAPAAQRFKQVIEMANDQARGGLQLVFADTKGDPTVAVEELERLALKEGVIGVLGPLLKEHAMPAAEAAQAMHLPMVSLSQSQSPTDAGEFVFRGFLPLEQQVKALLAHATQDRGFQRLAILYPQSSYGETVRDLFLSEANRVGVTVVREQSYNPESKVFQAEARKLGDKSRRSSDPNALNPPTIDYDALFIPDNYQRVALVASSLAVEEFPVGTFRPSRRSEGLPLLGLNAWNNPQLVQAGGQYVWGGVFVDAFSTQVDDGGVQAFTDAYRSTFDRPPIAIDAVTYDAARLLALAAQQGGSSRLAVRDALADVRLTEPVGAGARFNADREVARRLHVLTVTESGIRMWRPPDALEERP
ncbi:MAG: penicillin-binding protein activator [Myxococcota bacterium]